MQGLVNLRAINATRLLFTLSEQMTTNFDAQLAGLWTINTNGTGLRHLVKGTIYLSSSDPWSTVSRDGRYYAVIQVNQDNQGSNLALLVGALSGGTPTTLTTVFNSAASLTVAGWTEM